MIPVGPYRHRNGGLYTVLACAEDSTNVRELADGSQPLVVVYVSLTTGKLLVRDLAEFVELDEWPDGSRRPRFVPTVLELVGKDIHLNDVDLGARHFSGGHFEDVALGEHLKDQLRLNHEFSSAYPKDTVAPPTEKSERRKSSSSSSDRIRAALAVEDVETDDGEST